MKKKMYSLDSQPLWHLFLLGLLLLNMTLLSAQSTLDFELVAQSNGNSNNNWITVRPELTLSSDAIIQLTNLSNDVTYELLESRNDNLGMEHYRYQQKYKSYPVEGSQIRFHGEENNISHFNHSLVEINQTSPVIKFTEAEALNRLLEGIDADMYAWESADFENQLKEIKQDPAATYYPTGDVVWSKNTYTEEYHLTYRFDVYAIEPLSRKFYYVDVTTGELVAAIDRIALNCFEEPLSSTNNTSTRNNHHHSHSHSSSMNAAATGICSYVTANNGSVNFTSENEGGQYILKANSLGSSQNQVVHTMNANNRYDDNNLTEFTDGDNHWENDPVAVSVHWGTTETFEYFEQYHARNSYDNNGAKLFSRVHFGNNYVNAFWDGTQMTYGDGDGTNFSALTSLDVVSHEITHAVTQYNSTGGLIYQNESGALNESFSDIFGAVVEFKAHPNGGDWLMGEDFDLANGVGFRNMEDPNLQDHPKTYGGLNWYTGRGDRGGVHINSGVQNHWFYLLTTGGSGTNEYGIDYSITPISMEDGAAIAYRNLTRYLTPNATYLDAVNGSIQASIDLFGRNSAQHIAVQEAWCAVGLGLGCLPTITLQRPIINEVLTSGTYYIIEWGSDMLSSTSKVKIEYTTDTGADETWTEIIGSIANSGNYGWFVPNIASTTVRLRISDLGDPVTNRSANPIVLGISDPFTVQTCLGLTSFSYPSQTIPNAAVAFTSLVDGLSYEWSIDGTIVSTAKNMTYTFPDAGDYVVKYKVIAAGGCQNIEEQVVTILSDNANGFSIKIGDVNNNQYARTQDVFQAKNGDYLLLTNGEAVLSCYDAQGNKKWTSGAFTAYPSNEYRMAATQKSNGNFVIVSSIRASAVNQGNSNDKIAILELNGTNGSVINSQLEIFEGTGELYPEEIINTSNGGFVIGGEVAINGQRDIFLLELDASKNIVQTAFYGDSSIDDSFSKIIQTTEGGYLFTGTQRITNVYSHFLVVKLDANLNTEWSKKNYLREGAYSGIKSYFQINIVELPAGKGYLLLAGTPARGFFFIGRPQSYLIRLDHNGNYIEADYFATTSDVFDPILLLDGVEDGAGGITFLAFSLFKHFLFNIDKNNKVNWAQELSGIPVETAWNTKMYQASLIRTGDGGYLASLSGEGSSGLLSQLYKTDQLGKINCDSKTADIFQEGSIPKYWSGGFSFNHTDFNNNLSTNHTIQYLQSKSFNPATSNLPIQTSCSFQSVTPVIASFYIEDCFFEVGSSPEIINNSQGATSVSWKINGVATSFPFPPFNESGEYVITLIASNGSRSASTSKTINVFPYCYGDLMVDQNLTVFGVNEAQGIITSTATINAGIDRTFTAGNSINLLPGFQVKQGATFLARIETCQAPSCRAPDSLILVKLYNTTQGANWTKPWDLNMPINTWHGIYLNGGGCVTDIRLSSNNLVGNLPPELGNLSELEHLYLGSNKINGILPAELGMLSNLETLYLRSNQLTESIPLALATLSSLHNLDISSNQLTGSIPPELGSLSCLKSLFLNHNQLSGNIPSTLAKLKLDQIGLNANQLSGCFPKELRSLCTASIKDFKNNADLPGGGDFDSFCSNEIDLCNFLPLSGSALSRQKPLNAATPSKSLLLSLMPNPVSKEALIKYNLPIASEIHLAIYDVKGQIMKVLHRKELRVSGVHEERVDVSAFPNGVYFIRIGTSTQSEIIKMVVARN